MSSKEEASMSASQSLQPRMRFNARFIELYNEYCSTERGNRLLALSGVSREQLDVATLTQKYFGERISDVSIDPNANVGNAKSPNNFGAELAKGIGKLTAYHLLWTRIAEEDGDERASELIGRMWKGYIYFHDLSGHGITTPYCFAASTYQLILQGRPYGQLRSLPPKRSDSFMSQAIEFTMDMSQEFMGAVALGDLLVNFAVLCKADGVDPASEAGRKYIMNKIQSFVHVVNNKFRTSAQSPFTNVSVFDRPQLQGLFQEYEYPNGMKAVDHIEYIMVVQEMFLEFMARKDPDSNMPYRFPVTTVNITTEKKQVLDPAFLDAVCRHNREGLFNVFVTDGVGKVAMCCRYLNDVKAMRERQRTDVWGNGGLNIGSTRVCTVNLARLAFEAQGPMEFKALLRGVVNDAMDLLLTHRELLEELVDDGYLKFFKPIGWISMRMLFSTVGLIGMYEALSLFGDDYVLPSKKGIKAATDILRYIDELTRVRSEQTGVPINVEQIPAETAAITLAKADQVFYPKSPFDLYSNQSIPLWVDVDMLTRAQVDGEINHCYSGGGISHLNIASPVTVEQHKRLIEFGIQCGLDHFALNCVFCRCENHHTSYGKSKRCPQCGGKIVERRTRVVGYFTPVEDWTEVRRKYEFPKRVFGEVPFGDDGKPRAVPPVKVEDEVEVGAGEAPVG